MSTIANLTLRQQMFCFAYLAYTGEGMTTPPEGSTVQSAILAGINTGLSAITSVDLSGWNVVWGPAVYTVPGGLYQDNLVYILNKQGTSDYVIAIRGTNFFSQVDWFLEDFEVINTMPWPLGSAATANGAAVTESTSIDMAVLLSPNMADNGTALLQYLQSITEKQENGKTVPNPVNICVTGHSLGGALSSTLALWLLQNTSQWDNSGKSTVCCISFAGPTAGNQAFATLSNTVFTAAFAQGSFPGWDTSLGSNCDVVICGMDVAPQFYIVDNIYNNGAAGPLFNTYGNDIDFSFPIGSLWGAGSKAFNLAQWVAFEALVLAKLAPALSTQNYTALEVNGAAPVTLPGTFYGTPPPQYVENSYLNASFSCSTYLEAFASEAAWQHSYSYPTILGITELQYPSIINRYTPASSQPQTPVISSVAVSGAAANAFIIITGTGFNALNLPGITLDFSGANTNAEIVCNIQFVSSTLIYASLTPASGAALNQGTQNITVNVNTVNTSNNTPTPVSNVGSFAIPAASS